MAFGRPALAQQEARVSAGEALRIAVPGTEARVVARLCRAAGAEPARLPMRRICTANDSDVPPDLPEALHAAFTAAGGRAAPVRLGPFGADGHRLFPGRGGSAMGGPALEGWLARLP